MEDEIKSLLQKNLEVTKDNNRLLRKIRRSAIIGGIFRMIWFAFLIGVPVVLYYYLLQPLLNDFIGTYQGLSGQVENISETGKEMTTPFSFPGLEELKGFFR